MGTLCRDAGESGHAVGEVAFAVGDGLLVAHSSVDVAVAGELHELLGGGARDGGHGGGEVTQVVEAEVGASDLVAGSIVAAVNSSRTRRRSSAARRPWVETLSMLSTSGATARVRIASTRRSRSPMKAASCGDFGTVRISGSRWASPGRCAIGGVGRFRSAAVITSPKRWNMPSSSGTLVNFANRDLGWKPVPVTLISMLAVSYTHL